MTLLTTEIVTGPFQAIVFAADRRISLGGKRHTERRKILPVPRKRAGVGYFGLAELPLQGPRRHMDVWLGEFLQANSHRENLGDLGDALAQELNRLVPGQTRRSQVSGFHLSGFNDRAKPNAVKLAPAPYPCPS